MLQLLYKNIRGFVTKYKFFFLLFCVSQIVSILSVFVIYAITAVPQKADELYDLSIRTLSVTRGEGFDGALPAQLKRIAREKPNQLRNLEAVCKGEPEVVAEYLFPKRNQYYIQHGRYFTQKEFSQGKAQMIISYHHQNQEGIAEQRVGDHVTLFGRDFEIVGGIQNDYYEIPFGALPSAAYESVQSVDVVLEEVPDRRAAEQWRDYLRQVFPGSAVSLPQQRDLNLLSRYAGQVLSSLSIGLLAVLNISYLYKYVLQRRKRAFAIVRICGCSRRKGILLLLTEALAYSTALFLLSIPIYVFFLKGYTDIYNDFSFGMGWTEFFLLYLIYTLTVLVVFGLTIFRFSRQAPYSAYQEGGI